MAMLVLTIIEFAGAMGVPVFLTAIVESAASKMRETWRVVSFWIRVWALFCLLAWKLLGDLVKIAVLNGWSNLMAKSAQTRLPRLVNFGGGSSGSTPATRRGHTPGRTRKAPITLSRIKRRKLMSMLGISSLILASLLLALEPLVETAAVLVVRR
jgi:hypothetical protein